MKKQQLCLSVSKRNQRYLDLVEDYSTEFNMNKTQTIFKILKEYNTLMNGGNVIDDNFRESSVRAQLDNICKLLGGEVTYHTCCDRTTEHKKIVIEYDHRNKE